MDTLQSGTKLVAKATLIILSLLGMKNISKIDRDLHKSFSLFRSQSQKM